ncbi:uncharacterized protein LOC144868761 isoform X2 [Branchiostoma floridae x Branchiostoma japonicum]
MSSRRTRPRVVTGVLAVLLAASWSPLPRGTAVDVAATSSRAVDPVVNVARGKPVRANVTCGSPVEDFYPHSDSVKPPPDRQLQICDASDPVLGHNASLMTDGNSSTWWQSTSLRQLMSTGNGLGNQAEVYITLDLGETYHPENITIHMGDTKRPGRLAIMKSADGRNFDPWLYLVTNGNSDCRRFGVANLQPEPDSPESVVCREYPQLGVEQLYNERIIVSLFEVPPSFSDEDLLRWQAVRHLQLHFYDMDLVLGIFEDQFHHYAVSEVSVMAGCECNGLGNGCEISADSGQYECICSGNTQGPFCEECQPLYNQFPYQPGQPCRACNCNNHSQVCVYNETVAAGNLSMSANGSFHGGGVCLSCRDNTTGTNCEQCDTLFYRNPEVSHQSSLACLPCECDLVGSSSSQCNMETGQCPCKPGVGGRMCDVCLPGYYNFSSGGCIPCPCYPLLHHTPCYVDQGGQVTCNCTQGHKGEQCERCEDFYWGDPVHGTACAECDCSGNSDQCSNVTGECIGCHGNTTGFNCDRCADGFYGDAVFGNCSACACDESGSVALVCNHTTGLCPCKPGVDTSTRRCSGCMENHYGFDTPDGDGTDSQPGCSPCNCNDLGSTSLQCGEGGNCSCLPGVEGTKCDVCMEGTYGLPDMECLACDCDPVGTLSDFDPFLPTTTQSAVGQTTILGLTTTQDITTQGALIGSTPIQGITDDTTLQAETTAIPTTVATTNVTSSATSQVLETPGVTTGQAETTDTATTVDTTNVTLSATSQGPETPGVTTVQAETTDTATNVTSSATSQGPETPGVTTVQAETTDTATNVTSSATSQGPETPSVTTVQAETTDTATNVTSSATSQGPETPGVTTVQAETTDTATTVDTTNVTSSATSQGPETPSVTTVQAETTDTATTVDTTNVTTSATSQGPEAPGATTVQAETTDTATNVTTSATSQGPETPGVTTVQAETTAIPTTVAATNDTSSATSQGPETPGVTTVQAETTDTTTTVATTNSTSSATSQGPETTDVTTVQETTDTVATTNGTTSTTDTGLGTTDFAGTTNVTSVVAITNDMTVPTETTNITTAVTSTDGLETIGVTTVQTETTDIATVVTTTNDTLDVSVATEVVTTDNDTAVTENATTVTPLATANVPAVSTNATETSTTNNGTGRFVEEGFQARQRRQVAQQSTTVSTPVDTTGINTSLLNTTSSASSPDHPSISTIPSVGTTSTTPTSLVSTDPTPVTASVTTGTTNDTTSVTTGTTNDTTSVTTSTAPDTTSVTTSTAPDTTPVTTSTALDTTSVTTSAAPDTTSVTTSAAPDTTSVTTSAAPDTTSVTTSTAPDTTSVTTSAAPDTTSVTTSAAPDTTSVTTSAAPDTTSVKTSAAPDTTSVTTSAAPDTTSVTTSAAPDTTSVITSTAPDTTSVATSAAPDTTSVTTSAAPDTTSVATSAAPDTTSVTTSAAPDTTSVTTSAAPDTTSVTTSAAPDTTSVTTSAAPDTTSVTTSATPDTTSVTTSAAPDTTSVTTSAAPDTTSVTTSAAPDTTSVATSAAPDTTSVTTSAAPDTTSVTTSAAPDTTPVTTSAAPDTTSVTTSTAPDTTSVTTSTAPDTTPVTTSTAPDTTSVTTSAAPDTTSVTTSTAPGTTSVTTSAAPDTTSVSTSAAPDTTSVTTSAAPDTTSVTTSAAPDTTSVTTSTAPDTTSVTTSAAPDTTSVTTSTAPDTTSVTTSTAPDTTSVTTSAAPDTTSVTTSTAPDTTSVTTSTVSDTTSVTTSTAPDTTSVTTSAAPDTTSVATSTAPDTTSVTTSAAPDTTSVTTLFTIPFTTITTPVDTTSVPTDIANGTTSILTETAPINVTTPVFTDTTVETAPMTTSVTTNTTPITTAVNTNTTSIATSGTTETVPITTSGTTETPVPLTTFIPTETDTTFDASYTSINPFTTTLDSTSGPVASTVSIPASVVSTQSTPNVTSAIPLSGNTTVAPPQSTTPAPVVSTVSTPASVVSTQLPPNVTSAIPFSGNTTVAPPASTTPAPVASTVTTPASVVSTVTTPAPVVSTVTTPAPVVSTATTPAPVVSTVSTPASVVSTVSTPASVVSTVTTPAPVVSTVTTPAPVVSTVSTPAPVVSTVSTPAPVVSTVTTLAPVVSTVTTPAPVVSTVSTPAPVVSTVSTPASVVSTVSTPASVVSTVTTPAPVVSTVSTPASVVSTVSTPASVVSTVTTPAPVVSTVTTPAPVVSTVSTPAPVVSTVSTPASVVPTQSTPIVSSVTPVSGNTTAPVDTTPAPVATTMLVPVTRNHTCQRTTGQCKCKKGVGGRSCNVCLPMYHGFGEDGCSECSACEQTLHRFLTVTESDWHRHWRMAGEVTTLQTLDRPLQDISVAIETVQQDLNQSALDLGDVNETVSNLTGELPILNRTADSLHSQVSVLFPVAQQLLNSSSAEYMRLEQLRRTAQDVLTNTTAANQTAFLDISQLSENKASARTMLLRAEQLLDNLTAVSFNDLGQQSQAVLAMAENASQAAQGLNATISTEVEEATAVNDSLTAAQTLLSRVTSSMDSTKLTADIILKAAEDVEQHLSTAEGHRQQVAVLVNETASLLSDAEMTLQVADLVLRNATLEFEQTEALLNGENGWTATAAELNSSSIQTAAQLTALTAAVQKAEAYAANLTVQADAVDNVFQTARLQGQAAVNAILGYQEASLLLNESAAIAQEVNATVQNLTEYIQSVSIATLEGRANQSLAASWELQEELDGRNMSAAGLLQEVRSANANLSAAQMEWGSVGDQLQLLDGELQGAEAAAQEGDITTSLEEGFRLVETAANQSTAAEVDIAEVSSGVEGVRGQLVVIQETSNNMTTIVADLQQTVSGTNGTLQAFLQQVQNVSQLQTDATTMQARLEQRMARLQTKMLQLEQAAQRLNSPMHFDSNTSAMLELPASRSPVFSSIAMDTRVGQLNESAVLVYGENHQTGEFLLVSMEDEHMTFTFNVSGDQQKPIRVDSNLRLCTNCWYHVQATRYRNEGTLTVTDLDTQATTSVQASDPEVTGTDLTLTSALYVGGAPLGAQVVQSGRYGGFAGCVANLEVEGQPLNLWTTPLPITGTPSCCQYPPSTSNPQPGVSFDGFGYLILSDQNFNIISQSQISLQFRTFNTHAVILLAEGEGGYYGLFLEEGHLVFQLEDSGINPGRENVTSDLIYNDGTWYELTVSTFPGVSVTMVMRNMIDGTVVENKTAESHLVLGGGGGGTQIVLGSQHPNQTNSVGPTSVKFAGCLQDVRLNDRTVQLNTNSSSSADVSFQGCLPQVVPGVGFRDDSSFSQLAVPLDYRGAAEIRFELKPDKLDGVLLYAEDSSDADHFFYLALYNGHLFGVHQPAQGQAQVLQPSSNLLVDQQWHLVELNITAGSISVQVDRSGEASAGVLTGALSSAHLYLAGVGPALQEKLNRCEECPVVVSYTGGMQGVSVNSRVLDFLDPATVLSQRGVYLSGLDPPQNVTAPTLPPPGPTVAPPSCADPFQPAYSREGVNFGRHGNSYISYSLSPETMVQYFRTSFVLRCQFRAEAPDGILYYSANFRINPDNHLGLYMSEGYLHADMRTQQASNGDYHSLKVRTQFRDYADGNWWEVVILRIHNFLAIIVPERRDYVNNNQQSNIQTFINLDTPFYVGGTDILASGLSFPLPIKAGFAGCIRLLEISTAQPVDTVSFDLGSPDDHFNIGQCYEAVQPGTAFNGTGFITMGTQSLESGLDVSVQFSTVQRSFLLLLLYQDPGNYFLMDAEDGRIRGHLRKNNITTTIRTTHVTGYEICDGEFHTLVFSANLVQRVGVLLLSIQLDELPDNRFQQTGFDDISIDGELYVGGGPVAASLASPGLVQTPFKGCLESLVFGEALDLRQAGLTEHVTSGCPARP